MLERIDHVNIVVENLEAMTRFYRDRLGLKVTKQVTISGPWIDDVVGLKGVEADVVYLDPPIGPRVELIKYRAPIGRAPDGMEIPNTKGFRHIAFKVDDIDATVETLRRGGVTLVSDVREVPSEQVTYSGGLRKRLVYFHDPEGNLLELAEYRSAAAALVADPGASLAPSRRRRAARMRRRLMMSMTALALIIAAVFISRRILPPQAPTSAAATSPAVIEIDWQDIDNPEMRQLHDAYLKTESHAHRGKVFEHYVSKLQYTTVNGAKISGESLLDKLGRPDLYRDLGSFRFFAYYYTLAKANDCVVDIDFDASGNVRGFIWNSSDKADHSAVSWKPFPATESNDPKVLINLLPRNVDAMPAR